MPAAIDIDSVRKRYGSFEALRGVSLRIEAGEFSACSDLTVLARPR